ncbi:response regulator [Robiginitalea sp. IMCC43444]|uniref:response regulator n=1 Tax=Robiginitalea sp. IMCC43444 TaxID=3459121 RepID=UPI004040F42D
MPHIIYLIDDDQVTLYMHGLQLGKAFPESEIISFDSASDALTALQNPDAEPPALVLMDINLPVMDAWEFLDAVHSRNIALNEDALFLLSSEFSPADREELSQRDLEKRAYRKPLDGEILKEMMQMAG